MKKITWTICVIILFFSSFCTAQENPLDIFKPFMGKTWSVEGKWGNGTAFKQDYTFRFSLEGNLVVVESKGFVDKEQTQYGQRNHGIRKFDAESNSIVFYEFDVFGGVTTGKVFAEGKNILYQYEYGGTTLTDMWEYQADGSYVFKVGSYTNGKWEQVYLTANVFGS